VWSPDSPCRPFCSERCRLIDLGAWADGSYSIPTSSTIDLEKNPDAQHSSNDDNFEG